MTDAGRPGKQGDISEMDMDSVHRPVAFLDAAAFESETAALAALANLKAEGPSTARDLIRRIERAARTIGEGALPFKHATIYAVLHELEFDGAVSVNGYDGDERRTYSLAPRGRAYLAMAQQRWRSADLVIRAAAAPRETV